MRIPTFTKDKRRHILLVVSKEPLAPFDLNLPGLEHCIEASVEIEHRDDAKYPQRIDQFIKQGIHGTAVSGTGHGENFFGTILSWLSSINSRGYMPFRNQKDNALHFLEDELMGDWKRHGPFEFVSVARDEKNNPVFRFRGKNSMIFKVNWIGRTVTTIPKVA